MTNQHEATRNLGQATRRANEAFETLQAERQRATDYDGKEWEGLKVVYLPQFSEQNATGDAPR